MAAPWYTAYLQGSLLLSARGEWWHNGAPFVNPRISSLFHRSICWDEQYQDYVVRIGTQQATFSREDTPYFVTFLDDSSLPWRIELSDGSCQLLDSSSLRVGPEYQIYCRVKDGDCALFLRNAHQALLAHGADENSLLIGGERMLLKPLESGTPWR